MSVSNSEVHTFGERLEDVVGNVFVMLVKCGRGVPIGKGVPQCGLPHKVQTEVLRIYERSRLRRVFLDR